MGNFVYASRSDTRCVHFVRDDGGLRDDGEVFVAALRGKGVKVVYINFGDFAFSPKTLATILGEALDLENCPYEPPEPVWVRFMDDMIGLSFRLDGLVLVIDRADILFDKRMDEVYSLIESFLHQLHHWYDCKKPCHLFFQLEKTQLAQRYFGN